MYNEAMQRVMTQGERSSLAIDVLTWIYYSDEELSTRDLQIGVALHDGMTDVTDESISEVNQLISVCCGLVVVDEASNKIRLAHFTTQDYFNTFHQHWLKNGHTNLTMKCLQYLLMPNTLRPSNKEPGLTDSDNSFEVILRIMKLPLRGYALMNWAKHAKLAETENDGSNEAKAKLKKINDMAYQFLCQQPEFSSPILFLCTHHSDLWDSNWEWEWSGNLNYPVWFDLPPPRPDAKKWDISANGLHLAAYWGLTGVMPSLVSKFGIDSRDKFGQTALCWASKNGQLGVVKDLLWRTNQWDPSYRVFDTKIALLQAIRGNHVAVIKLLLGIQDDPGYGDRIASKAFQTLSKIFPNAPRFTSLGDCLVEACKKGNLDIIRAFVDQHPSLNFTDGNYSTPLIEAAKGTSVEIVKLLLDLDASPDFCPARGLTPLIEASSQGRVNNARLLLDRGAQVDRPTRSGRTALMRASYRDVEDVAKLLVARGADIDIKDFMDRTSLMEASAAGSEGIARLLVQKGADVNAKDKKGRTSLMEASGFGSGGIARLLVEKGADVTVKDEEGNTALQIASRGGHSVIIFLLLEASDTSPEGHAEALWEASRTGSEDAVKVLLTHPRASLLCGLPLERHPLLAAVEADNDVIVDMLLDAGFDIETKSKAGETPLILAAQTGREKIVRRLINGGADVNALDNSSMSAFYWAGRNKHDRIVSIFRDMGINYSLEMEENQGLRYKQY
ncbi:Ankyrin-3 [Fusarium oxysporum f. sp. rapae]|uniref:Ankyrin-3 n=1 Tax=Fusarium oxysporum f. sp. rapae TaxID=485398 RepID=A0A8J5NIH0_FUSOX|nr:Ankyrin-3 [Fusarium oxysporum f. sp. rapae]